MEDIFIGYINSTWGILVSSNLFILFGLKTYDVFAKIWPAYTGKYKADGIITYSEFIPLHNDGLNGLLRGHKNQGITSYSYRINNQLFNGIIDLSKLNQEQVAKHYYRGAKVVLYYSPRLPSYSFAGKKPKQLQIASKAISKWFVTPVLIITSISAFIWFLFNAGV